MEPWIMLRRMSVSPEMGLIEIPSCLASSKQTSPEDFFWLLSVQQWLCFLWLLITLNLLQQILSVFHFPNFCTNRRHSCLDKKTCGQSSHNLVKLEPQTLDTLILWLGFVHRMLCNLCVPLLSNCQSSVIESQSVDSPCSQLHADV